MKRFEPFLLTLLIAKSTSFNFAPGSYPNAEEYTIEVEESVLINAIKKI
jgi:hypothetical protein